MARKAAAAAPRRSRDPQLWPRAIRRGLPKDTPATAELWRRFKASDDVAAYQALCEHYAPLAPLIATSLKKRDPDRWWEDPDELVSDALFGLCQAVRLVRWPAGDRPIRFCLWWLVAKRVLRAKLERSWQGRRWSEARGVVERVRGRLVQEHGRVPTPQEMNAALAGLVTNPQFHVAGADGPQIVSSEAGRDTRLAYANAVDPSAPSPHARMMDAELLALAKRKLCALDRKILGRLLRGESVAEIARRFGLDRDGAARRLNGVLWELRCRADLAEYLGVRPDDRGDAPPALNWRNARALAALPPAKRAV